MKVPPELSNFLAKINGKVVMIFHRLGSKKRCIIGKAETNPNKAILIVTRPTYSLDCIFQGNLREYFSLSDFLMKTLEVVEIGGEEY